MDHILSSVADSTVMFKCTCKLVNYFAEIHLTDQNFWRKYDKYHAENMSLVDCKLGGPQKNKTATSRMPIMWDIKEAMSLYIFALIPWLLQSSFSI